MTQRTIGDLPSARVQLLLPNMSETKEMMVTFPGGLRVQAAYQGHTIDTDQGKEEGGDGSAPEPFVLFLASLGTCAGFYVLKFCQSRDISAEGIQIKQRMIRDDESKKLVAIELDLEVPESFPAKYHKALVRAADQCAVKRVLQNPPEITTKTVVL